MRKLLVAQAMEVDPQTLAEDTSQSLNEFLVEVAIRINERGLRLHPSYNIEEFFVDVLGV